VCATCGEVKGNGELSNNKDLTFDLNVKAQSRAANPGKVYHQNKATNLHFNSRSITCVIFSGNRATIQGTGEVKVGSQTTAVNFQVEVENNGPRGSGLDTFRLQLSNGYSAAGFVSKGDISFDFDKCDQVAATPDGSSESFSRSWFYSESVYTLVTSLLRLSGG
jgi:hypothetical protein